MRHRAGVHPERRVPAAVGVSYFDPLVQPPLVTTHENRNGRVLRQEHVLVISDGDVVLSNRLEVHVTHLISPGASASCFLFRWRRPHALSQVIPELAASATRWTAGGAVPLARLGRFLSVEESVIFFFSHSLLCLFVSFFTRISPFAPSFPKK